MYYINIVKYKYNIYMILNIILLNKTHSLSRLETFQCDLHSEKSNVLNR